MFGEARYKLRHNSHQAQFEKRRERERQWEESIERMAATNKNIAFATWENKTAAKIASQTGRRRLTELEHGDREALLARRNRLANLYNKEMQQWELEILNSAETVEERKQRILEKATKLRDARENARRQFVQDCYDRQWRDACDDARALDSHANTKWVTAQRWQQLEEKAAAEKENVRLEAQHMEKIMERIRYLEAQERLAKEERERRNQLLRQDLQTQVAYNADRRLQLWEQNAREDHKELEELRAIVRAEEEREGARRREALARGAEIRENNKVRSEMRAIAAKEARERDLVLLDYAIKKDRAGEAEEKAKKDEEKRMLYQYSEYLKEQMQKEAEDEAEYDAIRKKAEMRIWDERDAQLKARNDAREALMKEVHLGRQEQMRLKALREQEQLDADIAQARLDMETFQAEQERENQNEMRKRQERLDNAQVLREQMADRRARAEKLRQDEFLATKQMEAYETKHKERLGQQAGRVITYHPLKHTQWYT